MIARGFVPQGCLVKSVLENEAGRLSTEEPTLYRVGECYLRSMAGLLYGRAKSGKWTLPSL